MNQVILIGNLGGDPELKFIPNGTAVCNFNIATSDKWTDKTGAPQEKTEWHRIVVWGKAAENCGKYLSKGRQVAITGSIETRDWEDKEGVKRYTTEIKAHHVEFLAGGSGAPAGSPSSERRSAPAADFDNTFNDDDIPF